MIHNYPSLIAFVVSIICLCIYIFFLTPRQFIEVFRPKDYLTNLRWIILSVYIMGIITAIPPLVYQFYRAIGENYEFLRNVSTISSQISRLGLTVLLVLISTYRKSSKNKN